MTDAVLIVKVTSSETRTLGRSLLEILDSAGAVHATHNSWLASLAEQYRVQQTPVFVLSSDGWYYRDLMSISPAQVNLQPVISSAEFFERR